MSEASTMEATTGKITDEGIAKMRERIGVVVPRDPPFNTEASIDGIRHFTAAYGDENPLYSDPEYAASTRWGGLIAAPSFVLTMGESEVKSIRPELRARGAHALAGVHEFFTGDDMQFFKPIKLGDRLTKRYYLCAVNEKPQSKMSGGRAVHTHYRSDYINQQGELVAIERFNFMRMEREGARESGKQSQIKPAFYTDEELAEIDAAYAAQPPPRGSEPRYWEDVTVGDDIGTMVKGPLTTTDIIVWMRGWGGGVHSNRRAWKHRQRAPKFFTKNANNAWDVVQRVHWDDAMARAVGNPAAFDYGRMRSSYLTHLVTNWMGDDAWLWRLACQHRQFNFVGDVQWVRGTVVAKSIEAEGHIADLEVSCTNQRGERVSLGNARVILPSRAAGAVQLPLPDGADDVELLY